MNESIETLSDGSLLILTREGRRLVSVRFVAAAVAHFYIPAEDYTVVPAFDL